MEIAGRMAGNGVWRSQPPGLPRIARRLASQGRGGGVVRHPCHRTHPITPDFPLVASALSSNAEKKRSRLTSLLSRLCRQSHDL